MREKPLEKLLFALKSKANSEQQTDLAKVLQFLQDNPEFIKKMREFCENGCTVTLKEVSKEKVLAIFAVLNSTKAEYQAVRKMLTEEASVELQAILDLTVDRILKTRQDINFKELGKLTLICKWGFDGASGQSLYNQSFEHDKATTDSNIFISSLVPLKSIQIKLYGKMSNPHLPGCVVP
ncbi:dna-mediated transposase [Lasius niger]|uniref:Dna-mediated transposase n=1 Tax=Lasius niger TaxID=67767 RepID=A0A0J7NMI6_LASNI|nr:dna-mediated transposase [Lasius niger]